MVNRNRSLEVVGVRNLRRGTSSPLTLARLSRDRDRRIRAFRVSVVLRDVCKINPLTDARRPFRRIPPLRQSRLRILWDPTVFGREPRGCAETPVWPQWVDAGCVCRPGGPGARAPPSSAFPPEGSGGLGVQQTLARHLCKTSWPLLKEEADFPACRRGECGVAWRGDTAPLSPPFDL